MKGMEGRGMVMEEEEWGMEEGEVLSMVMALAVWMVAQAMWAAKAACGTDRTKRTWRRSS
jgi:hypothetical protein